MGGEGEDGGGRDERRRTKINRDLVDGGLKLCSPPQDSVRYKHL